MQKDFFKLSSLYLRLSDNLISQLSSDEITGFSRKALISSCLLQLCMSVKFLLLDGLQNSNSAAQVIPANELKVLEVMDLQELTSSLSQINNELPKSVLRYLDLALSHKSVFKEFLGVARSLCYDVKSWTELYPKTIEPLLNESSVIIVSTSVNAHEYMHWTEITVELLEIYREEIASLVQLHLDSFSEY